MVGWLVGGGSLVVGCFLDEYSQMCLSTLGNPECDMHELGETGPLNALHP